MAEILSAERSDTHAPAQGHGGHGEMTEAGQHSEGEHHGSHIDPVSGGFIICFCVILIG